MSADAQGHTNAALLEAVVSLSDGLELDETLHRIAATAARLVDARYAALGVLDERSNVSRFVYVGIDDITAKRIGALPQGSGILGLLSGDSAAVRLVDLTRHPAAVGFPPGHPPMRSFLGVPIRIRGRVYGNLYLTDKRHGNFSAEDEALLQSLATAAGVAIRNAAHFARSRRRQKWQQAVTAIDALVLASKPDEAVVAEATRRARGLASAAMAALAAPDEAGILRWAAMFHAHEVPADQRWSVLHSRLPPDAAARLAAATGAAGEVVAPRHRAHHVFSTGQTYTDTAGTSGNDALFGPALVLPLRVGAEIVGVLVLRRFAGDDPFSEEVITLAETFCAQVALALKFGLERRERERLAVFEERDRIARDLHDLVIQRLLATGMMLEGASRVEQIPPVLAQRIGTAVDELDATIKEIRTTIFELHDVPAGPSWVSVRARVLAEVERTADSQGPKPSVLFEGPVDTMVDVKSAGHLVAAVREGLSNAVRHSGATDIGVHVGVADEVMTLRVRDDGRGIGPAGPQRLSGLANLRARARALGGDCRVGDRAHEPGAELHWWIPLVPG